MSSVGGWGGGEAAFREEVFEEEGEALFGYGLGYEVGGGLNFLGGVAHCHPEARPLDHVHVIGAVPNGEHFFLLHTKGLGQVLERHAFASVRMADFAEVVVSVHRGDCAVEVGVHHGHDAADKLGVSDDNDLRGRLPDIVDEIGHDLSLDLQELFGPAHSIGHFTHVEMVPDVYIGIHATIFEETNQPMGKGQGYRGLSDDLVCDGVGRQGALVGNYGQGEAQVPAEGDSGVARAPRGQGHSRSGLQNAAYGSLGPLGEGSVGLAIKEGAVDVQSEESVGHYGGDARNLANSSIGKSGISRSPSEVIITKPCSGGVTTPI